MEEKHGSVLKQGKKRAHIRTDGRGGGGDIGGLVVWGGALAVAGLIAVSAIIRRSKRGDDATKKKYRSTKEEDSNIGDLQSPPSSAFQQNQCCTRACGSTAICETQMIDSCEVVTSKSLMVVEEEVSTPVINEGNAEYSTSTDQKPLLGLDLKQESTSYDQVENGIEEETTVLDDKMNSDDVSSILSIQEKEQEKEEEQQQRQEDEDDDEEETTVNDQMTSEHVSSILSIHEEKEEEEQQQADEDRDFDEGEEVNLGGTESISTESIRSLLGLDLKQESTSYDQVENGIEEETTVLDDKMNSDDVSSILPIQEKEQEEEEEQQQLQEDEDDDEEETTVNDQMTSEHVSSILSIHEEKEEEEEQQQADEDRDFDEGEEVNLGGTESISTESIREAISPAESIDALSLEIKKGGVVIEVEADNAKECDHESNRTDDNGTTTEKPASRTPWEEGNLKPIVDNYETTHATSMSRRLWSWSILVLLAMGLLLFTHLSISVRHLLHLDSSLVP